MIRRGNLLSLVILIIGLLVVPVFAEKLDIEIGSSYNPGENIDFKIVLYDEDNVEINGEIDYMIQNDYTEIINQGVVNSGEEVNFRLPENSIEGPWRITATYNDISINRPFRVGKLEKAEIKPEGDNQEISGSIPKGLVEIKEVVNEKDGLMVSYIFDNSNVVGEEVVVEIWIVDERGIEIKRVKDAFSINKDDLIERNIKIELPSNLVGIYSIYFALDSNLDDFVKQSVVLGKSSTTGFTTFDTLGGETTAYAVFVLVIILGTFFIWRRHRKEGPYAHKISKVWFWRKKK